MREIPEALPGSDIVRNGLADLRAGVESEAALPVAMAVPRLRALGLDVPEWTGAEPSHRLHALLCEGGASPHSEG